MKNLNKILIGIFIFCLLMVFITIFYQPEKKPAIINSAKQIDIKSWNYKDTDGTNQTFTLIIIDSCEYLMGEYNSSRMITHKGNCIYCTNRNKNFK